MAGVALLLDLLKADTSNSAPSTVLHSRGLLSAAATASSAAALAAAGLPVAGRPLLFGNGGFPVAHCDAGFAINDNATPTLTSPPEQVSYDSNCRGKIYTVELRPIFSAFQFKAFFITALRSFLSYYLPLLEPRPPEEDDLDEPEGKPIDLVTPFQNSVKQIARETSVATIRRVLERIAVHHVSERMAWRLLKDASKSAKRKAERGMPTMLYIHSVAKTTLRVQSLAVFASWIFSVLIEIYTTFIRKPENDGKEIVEKLKLFAKKVRCITIKCGASLVFASLGAGIGATVHPTYGQWIGFFVGSHVNEIWLPLQQQLKSKIKRILTIDNEGDIEEYLGFPTNIGRAANKAFKKCTERLPEKVNNWQNKLLSRGGSEVYLKGILQNLSAYVMSASFLPQGILSNIKTILSRCWWSGTATKQCLHLVKRSTLTSERRLGGMGFKDPELFNATLLISDIHRLQQYPDLPIAKLLAAKYHPGADILHSSPQNGQSYLWKSIPKGVSYISEYAHWNVGTGLNTNIWTNHWTSGGNGKIITVRTDQLEEWVFELLTPTRQWNYELLRPLFNPQDMLASTSTRITNGEDTPVWSQKTPSNYRSSNIYEVLQKYQTVDWDGPSSKMNNPSQREDLTENEWRAIWQAKVPRKMKVFIWLALWDRLPVADLLHCRGILQDPSCPRYGVWKETTEHCPIQCPKIDTWWRSGKHEKGKKEAMATFREWWEQWIEEDNEQGLVIRICISYLAPPERVCFQESSRQAIPMKLFAEVLLSRGVCCSEVSRLGFLPFLLSSFFLRPGVALSWSVSRKNERCNTSCI